MISSAVRAPVVSRRRAAWGMVIGEGGCRTSRPPEYSPLAGWAPAPEKAKVKDDYSDFGLSANKADAKDASKNAGRAAGRSQAVGPIWRRSAEFNLRTRILSFLRLLLACLAPGIFWGLVYYLAIATMRLELPILFCWLVPVLLAFYCCYAAGGIGKKSLRQGKNRLPLAVAAVILAVLVIGAALFACAWMLYLDSVSNIAYQMHLPDSFLEYARLPDRFADFVFFSVKRSWLFFFGGAALGWIFKR